MAHIANSWERFAETGLLSSRHPPDHMGFDLYCGCCKAWATDGHLAAPQRHIKNVRYWASYSAEHKLKQAVAYFTWPEAIAELEGICGPHIREAYEHCRNEHAVSLCLPQPFPALPMLAIGAPPPVVLPPLQVPPPAGAPGLPIGLQDALRRIGELERRLAELEAVVLERRGSAAASASDSGQDSWTQAVSEQWCHRVSSAGPEVATAGQAVEPALATVET